MEGKNYLTLKDAARFIGVNERTMKRILENNKDILNFKKLSGKYLISKANLENLLNCKDFVY